MHVVSFAEESPRAGLARCVTWDHARNKTATGMELEASLENDVGVEAAGGVRFEHQASLERRLGVLCPIPVYGCWIWWRVSVVTGRTGERTFIRF